MDLKVLDSKGKELGVLTSTLSAFVTEERNGIFELDLEHLVNKTGYEYLIRGNIIVCNTSDTLKDQQFRIYRISKEIAGRVMVNARHISFDLAKDVTEGLDIKNQSCEYVLSTLFRNSQFSEDYRGYSDIINAQDYKIGEENILRAIGGVKGSVLDTFGTGAEILRDNKNISVLNRRGRDNGVTIEYAKNLTGFNLTIDDSNLITRIKAFAKYTPEGGEETKVYSNPKYVDSPLIGNYETPYISTIDFTDKFKDNEIPTSARLKTLAEYYFRDTKCDIVKQNYKIDFIPLSKCVGYEGLNDRISLCDEVTIINKMYNITTQAKVIKSKFNVLLDRLESLELGEAKTTLGDVIGTGGEPQKGDKGDKGDKGEDGNIGDFPNSLPAIPILHSKVYGFSNVELSWTFENKVYYSYELYSSREKGFTPNTFNLLFEGQASTFLNQLEPSETWYYKVCAINSHGERTQFSNEVEVNTVKIDDLSNYVGSAAIGDALIGELNLGRGWFGELRGNYIDAKQLSVTDGNGKRTLDIDSFGNVNLDVASLSIRSENIETVLNNQAEKISSVEQKTTSSAIINTVRSTINQAKDEAINSANSSTDVKLNNYTTSKQFTEFKQSSENFKLDIFKSGARNILKDAHCDLGFNYWALEYNNYFTQLVFESKVGAKTYTTNAWGGLKTVTYPVKGGRKYYFSCRVGSDVTPYEGTNIAHTELKVQFWRADGSVAGRTVIFAKETTSSWADYEKEVIAPSDATICRVMYTGIAKTLNGYSNGVSPTHSLNLYVDWVRLSEQIGYGYAQHDESIVSNSMIIDTDKIECTFLDKTKASMGRNGFYYKTGNGDFEYHALSLVGTVRIPSEETRTITLPAVFRNKKFSVICTVSQIGTGNDAISNPKPLISFWAGSDQHNYANGTFRIYGSTRLRNNDGSIAYKDKEVEISYTVLA